MNKSEIKQDIADLKKAISSPATPEDKKKLFEAKVKELEEKLKSSEKKDDEDFYTAVSKKTGATSKITKSKIEPVAKKPSGKIALKEIVIHWAEGDNSKYPKFPQKYTSWSEANDRAIRPVYADYLESGGEGYNKVKYTVYWQDGEDYQGRLDVSKNEDNPTTTRNVIGKAIVDYLTWGISNEKSTWGESEKKEAKEFLANYDLGTQTKETKAKPKKEYKADPIPKAEPKAEPKVERKKSVPLKKSEVKDLEYDCDELIEKEKKRKANAKKRASMPKKSPATKNKEKLEGVLDNVKERADKGDISKAELIKLIAECKALLKMLQDKLAKL